ncbi:exocyst complex component exo84 [Stygiomarasmius scandens]|uniref:Exocyst complex component EXO84 n=1 Tax=Marasmiellus scandens TaxID=2682957 RepID=A0ABR1JRL3_9AGAR
MQSLRTRRSQAPRKTQRSGTKLSKSNAAPPTRESRKSRVDDKIKKRMSMRYADISSPTELNVPPMPTLPGELGPSRRAGQTGRDMDEVVKDSSSARAEAKAKADDKKLLDQESFDPDAYLKTKLANSTEAELKSLQSSLRRSKDDTDSELKKNVFKNYAELVFVSKEISTLENEMLELKESLSEYKSMPSLLHIPDPTMASSSSLSTYRRSSVADLRIMYFNQMQQLHAEIEGSAKFAPTTPGRHVVAEVDGILSLNAATYKVMGKVKFVILDDAVLVAKRRRRAGGESSSRNGGKSEGKLVAERCWPLHETVVLDTKDSASMTNVFKIRYGKETHVYRTETPAEKKGLLQQLRAVGDELLAKKRKEREGEHERRKSMWTGGDRSSSFNPEWMGELTLKAREAAGSDGKDKAERDTRWTGDWADELTVAIALREWEKATKLIEEGKARLAITPPLATKLPVLTAELIAALLEALGHVSNRKSTVVSLISLLLRLNAGPAARSTFLNMRTQVMRNHVRKIRFEGHIGAYVADLAMVYFTGIKHTADWFLASFKENEVASAFIDWARSQVEHYAEIFRNQVYGSGIEPQAVEEAMTITYSLSKKLLEEYGLDFRFLLEEKLVENPKETPKAVTAFKAPDVSSRASAIIQAPTLTASTSRRGNRPDALTIPVSSTSNGRTTPESSSNIPSTGSVYPETSGLMNSSSEQLAPPSTPRGPRSRTPMNGPPTPRSSNFSSTTLQPPPPMSAPVNNTVASPVPRHKTPPPSASPMRERPPRTARASPAPPPRSTNRPGSVSHRTPPVAVAQREGMI